jgi:hypothetical protein
MGFPRHHGDVTRLRCRPLPRKGQSLSRKMNIPHRNAPSGAPPFPLMHGPVGARERRRPAPPAARSSCRRSSGRNDGDRPALTPRWRRRGAY